MFRAKVLVGEATIGEESTKHPPLKGNGDHYDSTCDPSKSIFVSYHDSQCYPEYLISYIAFDWILKYRNKNHKNEFIIF